MPQRLPYTISPVIRDQIQDMRSWDIRMTVTLPDGTTERVRKRLTNLSKTQAENWAQQRRNQLISSGKASKSAGQTFATFAQSSEVQSRYISHLATSTRSKVQHHVASYLIPALGSKKLNQISNVDIADLHVSLTKSMAQKGQVNVLATLRRLLSLAVEWKLIPSIPQLPKIKVPKSEPKYLSLIDLQKLLSSARDHEEYTLLLFAADSGTRSAEQLALSWSDVRATSLHIRRALDHGTAALPLTTPKNKSDRHVPLSPELATALSTLRTQRQASGDPCHPDSLVFAYVSTTKQLYKRVARAAHRAGIDASRHQLRHTYASQLVSHGATLYEIQAWLGHQSAAMTQRYAHLVPDLSKPGKSLLSLTPQNQTT